MNKLISFLLIFSLLFPQEVCEGECYTDEEAQNIELYITELEQKNTSNSLIVKNLEEQLQLYLQQTQIDSGIIADYMEQIALQEELMKEMWDHIAPDEMFCQYCKKVWYEFIHLL